MRSRTSGAHPQHSLSPPPDLLSSSRLQQPPSPPPYKPTKFPPTKAMIMTTPPSSSPSDQQAPHVMVSRINARLSSIFDNGADSTFKTSRFFAQDDETTTDHSWCMSTNESFGHGIFGQTSTSSSVSSSLSYNGRWCEEERAIPLKKRRVVMVSYETNQSKEKVKKGALGEGKREMGEMERCNRGNGKGWRCNKMRVKGHSLCKHHLEQQRMRNIKINQQIKPRGRVSIAGRANQNQGKQEGTGGQGSIHQQLA
ncbi:hypothetical protein CRYUN_Cryun08bG0107000 [Craigia yunnanensis]